MVLEKTSALTKSFAPKNEADANKLKNTLASAGFRTEGLVPIFYGLKFALLVAGFFLGGGTLLWAKGFSQNTLIWVAAVSGAVLLVAGHRPGLPGAAAGSRPIFLALPDVLDMMVVCVEAGLGLDQAMRKVSDEMKNAYPVLAAEFALTNFHLQMGRTRAEALARPGAADRRGRSAVPGRRA